MANGFASINGGSSVAVGGALTRVETTNNVSSNYRSGYFGSTASVPAGSFNSFSVNNFTLTLNASGGTFSAIAAQPQNELKVSFFATPVPEPETYAMMLVGIGLIASIVRRRKQPAA